LEGPLLLKETESQQRGEERNSRIPKKGEANIGGSNSSSEEGETDTSDSEDEEVERTDSDEVSDADDENEPVGIVETDYRTSSKQVAKHIESQRRKAAQ
jgi:hypothetical protein